MYASTLLFLILFTTVFSARLRFYQASQSGGINNWKSSKFVTSPTFKVCSKQLPNPFTLVCLPSKPSTYAKFFINGVLHRTEHVLPYTIAGDIDGLAAPWKPSRKLNVQCRMSSGETVTSHIIFSCPRTARPTKPPVDATKTTKPPSSATPPDFNLGSGNVGKRNIVPSEQCVKIPALKYKSANIGKGKWEKIGAALFYKPQDKSTGIIPGGKVTATYKFKAPVTSVYGFTLDMKTNGGVDHNDVWVNMPVGFRLTKGKDVRTSSGWTKAYHNRNKRDTQVYSVDFDAHTFSTKIALKKGREYTVSVGGRSTKTGFYSIIMFPCIGKECDGTRSDNSYWRSSRDRCAK